MVREYNLKKNKYIVTINGNKHICKTMTEVSKLTNISRMSCQRIYLKQNKNKYPSNITIEKYEDKEQN